MIQIVNRTLEEKRKMYDKLSKNEIIDMLISANNVIETLSQRTPTVNYTPRPKVPYHQVCQCNPSNGGSGVCNCTLANEMVDDFGNLGFQITTITTNVTN